MTDKKGTGKSAGSTRNWRQLGGGKRSDSEEPEHSDSQISKSSNFQNAETLNTQSVESSDVQQSNTPSFQNAEVSDTQNVESLAVRPSEMVKGQNMNSLAVQDAKGIHKGRTQKTLYLPPRLARRLDRRALDEDRERSEIVADALELYFRSVPLAPQDDDEE